MNVINYRVSLDMFDTHSQITIKAKKRDSACKINITLTKNGRIFHIDEGCYATFNAKKSDGNFIYDNCTIEGDTIVYDFSSSIDENGVCQVSAMEGNVECEITLYNANNEQLTSPCFTLYIDNVIYNGEEIVSSSESDVLRSLIVEAQSTVNEIETKLENGEFVGKKGEKGDAGVVKFIPVTELPTENIDECAIYMKAVEDPTSENTYEEFIYVDGKWESIGVASIEVDLTDYVKNTDYATTDKGGVIKIKGASSGLIINDGQLTIASASPNNIKFRDTGTKPIVPQNLDYAIKIGLTTNTETLTDEEKASALNWLGALPIKTTTDTHWDRVYAVDKQGNQKMLNVGASQGAGKIVVTDGYGNINISEPRANGNAATKKYVDDAIDTLETDNTTEHTTFGHEIEHLSSSCTMLSDDLRILGENVSEKTEELNNKIDSKLYPVGSVFVADEDVDPNVLLGGEWEKQKVLKSVGGKISAKITQANTAQTFKVTVSEFNILANTGNYHITITPISEAPQNCFVCAGDITPVTNDDGNKYLSFFNVYAFRNSATSFPVFWHITGESYTDNNGNCHWKRMV